MLCFPSTAKLSCMAKRVTSQHTLIPTTPTYAEYELHFDDDMKTTARPNNSDPKTLTQTSTVECESYDTIRHPNSLNAASVELED